MHSTTAHAFNDAANRAELLRDEDAYHIPISNTVAGIMLLESVA